MSTPPVVDPASAAAARFDPRVAWQEASELIDSLEVKNPEAVRLAVAVSLASRIEPELLRAVRLTLLPEADASAEADLWLSPLMSSRSVLYAVMGPAVTDALRERLCADPERLSETWNILTRVHENAPAALRTEEEITWRVMTNPDDPEISRLFDSVFAALSNGRAGLARWAARALPRMPAPAKQNSAAWRLAEKAAEVLGGEPILRAAMTQGMATLSPAAPIEDLPKVPITLRMLQGAVRITEPGEEYSEVIELPLTTPLVLELAWNAQAGEERRTVTFGRNSSVLVRPIRSDTIRVTTAAREIYTLELLQERWNQERFTEVAQQNGFTVRAYRGDGSVMLAFDLEERVTQELAGFSIQRYAPGGASAWLTAPLFWAPANEGAAPIAVGGPPLRSFKWLDRLYQDGTGVHTYSIQTIYSSNETFAAGTTVRVSVDVTSTSGAFEIGFTDSLAQDAGAAPLKPERHDLDYDTGPYAERYRLLGGSAYRLITGFLTEAVQDAHSTLDVFAFDLDNPEIVKSFAALGERLRIVLDDSPVHKNRQYDVEFRLKKAGCSVHRAHFKRMSHNKVMVRRIDGRPVEVLTGSANFSINSLFAQQNHVAVLRDEAVASLYGDYFEAVIAGTANGDHQWLPVQDSGLPPLRVLLCPSKELVPAVRGRIRAAKRSILYSLGEPSRPDSGASVMEDINARRSSNELLVAGVLHGNSGHRVQIGSSDTPVRTARERRELTSTTTGATSGNGKFIVIDFDQPDAVVYVGSSSFSREGSALNGDNVLEIQDPAIATKFAIEVWRMIDSYSSQKALKSAPEESSAGSDWLRPYYTPGDPRYLQRMILANAPAKNENNVEESVDQLMRGLDRPMKVNRPVKFKSKR